jgi:hypothetical protein
MLALARRVVLEDDARVHRHGIVRHFLRRHDARAHQLAFELLEPLSGIGVEVHE